MDADRRVLTDAAILIDGERIVAVDKAAALAASADNAEVIDGHGMIAIPGLIDTHAHADQSLLRGLGDDLHWIPFLDEVINAYLARRERADVLVAYHLSMLEMLRSGTTCFVSPNVDARDDLEQLTEAIEGIGIRAVLARYVTPTAETEHGASDERAGLAQTVEEMASWHGARNGLIQMWLGLHTPRRPGDGYFPDFYPAVGEQARELGTGITYHFCSEIEDAEYYVETFGQRSAEWARANGVLGDNVLLINACWLTPEEIELVAATGTHVAHSPVANMKMATGIAPLSDFFAAGVNVSLGTDGGANNNCHDMIREMKATCLLQNTARRRAGAVSAERALELATIGGARAIGREHELGSLEPGKLADVVLVDLARPHTTPVLDPVSNLVYAANGGNVDTVIVAGRVLMRGGTLERVDERAILESAQSAAERIGAGIAGRERAWPRS